eukprot:TRINITY_DN4746_c0_g1_i1.p1 TRINITY_DN4746_c0_g1~~TRINITY_DN4746_c0_g1_i1.p1  ORF type:complete len:396 (+),score=175.82 TRINITY_DN4746_c0_g1_i1:77-1264(+)
MSDRGGSSLEALRSSLESLDGLLLNLEDQQQQQHHHHLKSQEASSSENRIHELETENAQLLCEVERLKREKESCTASLPSPLREDYDFLVYERVSLQSELGDLGLRLKGLESLLEEKNWEIQAKDEERADFMERFQRYETEKMNVLKQVISLEKDLEASTARLEGISREKTKAQDDLEDLQEVLKALREGKRVVEAKLTKVIQEKAEGQAKLLSLSGQVASLEESLSERETTLAEKVSFYESQSARMQVEMNARLEEMNNSNDLSNESLRSRYVDLFEEKVQELFTLRGRHEESLSQLESSERKRGELEVELRDLQSQFTSVNKVNAVKVQHLEEDLQGLRAQFGGLKESCVASLEQLRGKLRELRRDNEAKSAELLNMRDKFPKPSSQNGPLTS